MIRIVGLGPAGIDAMSIAGLQALESGDKLYLRTGKHPAAEELVARGIKLQTFDSIYEAAGDFDEVYRTIAAHVIAQSRTEDVIYAVPGHPLVAERSVELILQAARSEKIELRLIPSPSFIDACFEALEVSLGEGVKLIDALALTDVEPAGDCPSLIYQVYDSMIASETKLALMNVYPDEFSVYIISKAGGADVAVHKVPLWEMDRMDYDHLTSVYVPNVECGVRNAEGQEQ